MGNPNRVGMKVINIPSQFLHLIVKGPGGARGLSAGKHLQISIHGKALISILTLF